MNSLFLLFEAILNENPNQAIKFLKDKNLDPDVNSKGKQILDTILNVTRGDGFTHLLTKFYVNDRKSIEELSDLHGYLKNNKTLLNRFPKPVLSYETYRELRNQIDYFENERVTKRFTLQLSPQLRDQINNLTEAEKQLIKSLAQKFSLLTQEQQRHFMKKVFGYKDVNTFIQNIQSYITEVQSGYDYESTKAKILKTESANLVYDNPEGNILIAHINSFEASKYLGCASAWCIAKDLSRYKQYKSGGNFYFFIWDYNYPVNNSNFFIATAYNPNYPEKSQTHEHLNDGKISLDEKITEKKLSYTIFDNYIKQFKEERKKLFNSNSEIAIALQEQDKEKIREIIEKSYIHQEYGTSSIDFDYRGENVDLNIKKDDMKSILEIGEEFEYINNLASPYNICYYDYYDNDEANYMHGRLNNDNINLLIDLAKKLNIDSEVYESFSEKDGAIQTFLNEIGLGNIVDRYLYDYSKAQNTAERNEAQALIDLMPFNFDNDSVSFNIESMYEYYIENELTANNFDELLEQIKSKLPYYSYESVSEARYVDLDLDEVNRNFKKKILSALEDIENDEDNPLYQKARLIRDSKEYLIKLGFKMIEGKKDKFAEYFSKDNKINIVVHSTETDTDDDDNEIIKVTATITPKIKGHFNKENAKTIKIPITSLKYYIDQYQLNLHEQLTLMGIFKNIQ